MSAGRPPVVAVVGPTGSGKTALGVELALRLGGEVVNADSMQLYRGMDIGTAKATPGQRRGVPHHLLDVLDVTEDASVAGFQHAARESFAQIRRRGGVPVLVGGSGLYVRAALDVLELPGTDPAVRARIEDELAEHGPGALRQRLRRVDPDSAARLRDDRRVVRALEVWELTGRPFTSFMPRREHVEPTVQIGLAGDPAELHARLARRVGAMVAAGFEDEVRALAGRGLREGRTASRALGYGQFLDVVDGRATVAEAAEATVRATRRLARRQRTWFRSDPRVHWLDPADPRLVGRALDVVRRAGHDGG